MKSSLTIALALLLVSNTASAAETVLPPVIVATTAAAVEVEPVIIGLKAGDKAPFDGVLLSPEAVATIIAEREALENKIMIERDKAQQECKIEAKKDLDLLKITRDADLASLKAEKDAITKNNAQLTAALKEEIANRPNPVLWSGLGAAAAGLVAAAVVLLIK